MFFFGTYGSLPDAAIWWCLWTGGAVFNPAHDIDDQKSPWEYFEKLGCHFAFRSTTDNENPIMVCIILPPAGQATSSLLKTSPVGLHVSQAPVLRWIVFCCRHVVDHHTCIILEFYIPRWFQSFFRYRYFTGIRYLVSVFLVSILGV